MIGGAVGFDGIPEIAVCSRSERRTEHLKADSGSSKKQLLREFDRSKTVSDQPTRSCDSLPQRRQKNALREGSAAMGIPFLQYVAASGLADPDIVFADLVEQRGLGDAHDVRRPGDIAVVALQLFRNETALEILDGGGKR